MRKLTVIKLILMIVLSLFLVNGQAAITNAVPFETSIDRTQLVTQQTNLLKNRLTQAENELNSLLKQQDEQISQLAIEKASKNLLDKASLDVAVAKSNAESISIELSDSQQTINWLEKNIQEIENQLNVLNIFGLKIVKNEIGNVKEYHTDLRYQQKLLELEKNKVKYLQSLQSIANNLLTVKKEKYNRLSSLLKSHKLLHMKQQQVKAELAYQEQQNYWLRELNQLYAQSTKLDPGKSKAEYAAMERNIFYANENANFAYTQSLIARYDDQIEQIKIAILKTNSLSLLNEIGNQIQTLTKQINRLDGLLKSRYTVLEKHITYLSSKRKSDKEIAVYLDKLTILKLKYQKSEADLAKLNQNLFDFRKSLDQALQNELSSRQGFPTFGYRTMLDLGKELLLVPALTFQIVKGTYSFLNKTYESTSLLTWSGFILFEGMLLFAFFFLHRSLKKLTRTLQLQDQINVKGLLLEWFSRNFLNLMIIGNVLGILYYINLPQQSFYIITYLALVWLTFKSIMTLSRICLVETTHDTTGHDVRLYSRLKWIFSIGSVITALTVFVHQLPLLFELKTLFDHLFLFALMMVSLLLLRYWDVLPNLILSHMESQHPYLQKSIRLAGILVPVVLFGNSVIGLFGYVNLIMIVSWYEGIFIIVMIVYLILRGLLSDTMEQLSRIMIQYVNNGWLWTEAFLKPLDTVLRITIFLFAWAVLFLIYGWDKRSPIVARLTGLLHYHLINILGTTITPINIIELVVVISVLYWTAKWTREFVYRMLLSRTQDMGIRNSIAVLSQYCVIAIGGFICLRVLGIDLRALAVVFSVFAFGVGWGLRDLANNFVSGFLILLERPLRVGDIVNINDIEGEVMNIGSRAVTVRTWDHMELVVPNTEIFNKSFTNWTAKDNTVRTVIRIKISRYDNPHEVKVIIHNILAANNNILKDPIPEVFLREMSDTLLQFELRYYVNIRQVESRVSVTSEVLMTIWDVFAQHGIKPPYPQHEVFLKGDMPALGLLPETIVKKID